MKEEYLQSIERSFRRSFPNSHLIIGYQISIHKNGTSHEWTLYIVFDECGDLQPCKVFKVFNNFKELEGHLGWQMYRHRLVRDNYIRDMEGVANET